MNVDLDPNESLEISKTFMIGSSSSSPILFALQCTASSVTSLKGYSVVIRQGTVGLYSQANLYIDFSNYTGSDILSVRYRLIAFNASFQTW